MDKSEINNFFTNMMDELGITPPTKSEMHAARLAKELRTTHDAMVGAGFTDEQAFQIVLKLLPNTAVTAK